MVVRAVLAVRVEKGAREVPVTLESMAVSRVVAVVMVVEAVMVAEAVTVWLVRASRSCAFRPAYHTTIRLVSPCPT